jgi:hypothetical protein
MICYPFVRDKFEPDSLPGEIEEACFLPLLSMWSKAALAIGPGASRFQFDVSTPVISHVDADGTSAQANVVLDHYLERQGMDRLSQDGSRRSGTERSARAFESIQPRVDRSDLFRGQVGDSATLRSVAGTNSQIFVRKRIPRSLLPGL